MESKVKKRKDTVVNRRQVLEHRAQRIQGRLCDAHKDVERLSAVYRKMSNLDPSAFVVIVRHCHDGNKAVMRGLSHNVSRGIETDGLHLRLEKSYREGRSDCLIFRIDEDGCDKCCPSIMIYLESGQCSKIFLGRGNFPTELDVFFSVDRKEALAFTKRWSRPRSQKT